MTVWATKRNEMMNKPVELNISCTTPVRFLCVISPGQGGGGSVEFVEFYILRNQLCVDREGIFKRSLFTFLALTVFFNYSTPQL